jgi:predicted dehydrogenase
MVNVGIVGIGFIGSVHYHAWQKVRGAKVTAICETDPKRRAGDWRGIKGNFGPPGRKMDLSGIGQYGDVDEMLADAKLDLVDVCLPNALHTPVTLAALKAGKHVLCEKPIATNMGDANRMVRAAERAGRQLMIAHVLPFFPEYDFAQKAIADGKYGRVLGGHFKRVISDPTWIPDFYDPHTTGGPMLDLHVHDAHFIRLVCGMPSQVRSVGTMRGEVAERFSTQFLFEGQDAMVTAMCGVIDQQGRPFTHAFEIYLEGATLQFDDGVPLTVFDAKGKAKQPKLASGDPVDVFARELTEATKAIRDNRPSPRLAGEMARDALLLCEKETKAIATGRAVKV